MDVENALTVRNTIKKERKSPRTLSSSLSFSLLMDGEEDKIRGSRSLFRRGKIRPLIYYKLIVACFSFPFIYWL